MKDKSYTATIDVDKSAQHVFDCIREVPKWWSKDFEGKSSNLNDEFVICHPTLHYSKQKLVEVIPNKKVVWFVSESTLDWLEKDQHEWTNTRMVFDISAHDDTTTIHFMHEGLVPDKECFEMCEQGWNMVIKQRLFNYITNGKTI